MVRRILIVVAALVVVVAGISAVASAGGGQGNGAGNSNPNANGNGANPADPPKDGCKPTNVPPRGEQPVRDDPRCPGYNGNAENAFTVSTARPIHGRAFTAAGGWCAGGSTVTFAWDPASSGPTTASGSLPVDSTRHFRGSVTIPTGATPGPGFVVASCSTGTRTAAATLS